MRIALVVVAVFTFPIYGMAACLPKQSPQQCLADKASAVVACGMKAMSCTTKRIANPEETAALTTCLAEKRADLAAQMKVATPRATSLPSHKCSDKSPVL